MSELKSNQQKLYWIMVFAFLIVVYFLVQDLYGILDDFPSVSSFLTDFMAGFIGVLLAFTIERNQQLKSAESLPNEIIQNLIVELEANREVLNELKRGLHLGNFIQFQTTAWDMFKEKMSFKQIDMHFMVGEIYHRFIEFNDNVKQCGDVRGAKIRMRDNPAIIYRDMIKRINEIINLL